MLPVTSSNLLLCPDDVLEQWVISLLDLGTTSELHHRCTPVHCHFCILCACLEKDCEGRRVGAIVSAYTSCDSRVYTMRHVAIYLARTDCASPCSFNAAVVLGSSLVGYGSSESSTVVGVLGNRLGPIVNSTLEYLPSTSMKTFLHS